MDDKTFWGSTPRKIFGLFETAARLNKQGKMQEKEQDDSKILEGEEAVSFLSLI